MVTLSPDIKHWLSDSRQRLMSRMLDSLKDIFLGIEYLHEMGMAPQDTGLFMVGTFPDQVEAQFLAGMAQQKATSDRLQVKPAK